MTEMAAQPGIDSAYGTNYFAATAVPAPARPQLMVDQDVDVCVIGAGLAGLTTAREIARRGWSVAVLEARRIAWGASGRNTGFVLPGYHQSAHRIIERTGTERARTLWRLAQAGVDYVRDTVAEADLPGVAPTGGGWLSVSKVDNEEGVARDAYFLRDTFGADAEFWPTERVRTHLKSQYYFQGYHLRDAYHIHPLNYALGLARLAEEAGARIYEDTPAMSIDPVGVRKRVVTPSARVRAAHVVFAGNVHLGALMPAVSETLLAVTTYLIATEPLGERVKEAIDFEGCVSDSDLADNHYRLDGERLIWSGRATLHEANPRRFARRLRRDIARVFPQLGKVGIAAAWPGTLGNTVHRMPQIGEFSPGLWVASGFGGHGLNTTAMAGNLIARAIVEGNRTWRHFEPFELIWAGGQAGRLAAKIRMMLRTGNERMAARMSRRRERLRTRKSAADERIARNMWARLQTEALHEQAATTEQATEKKGRGKNRRSKEAAE